MAALFAGAIGVLRMSAEISALSADECAICYIATQAFKGRTFGGASSRTATPLRSGEGGG
jgi:hypothetical protein